MARRNPPVGTPILGVRDKNLSNGAHNRSSTTRTLARNRKRRRANSLNHKTWNKNPQTSKKTANKPHTNTRKQEKNSLSRRSANPPHPRSNSLIPQQRRPLALLAHNLPSRKRIPPNQARHPDRKRQHKQQPADRKREDPLQLQDRQLGEELADARS